MPVGERIEIIFYKHFTATPTNTVPTMTVEIRPVVEKDANDIKRVAEQAWYEAHAPIIGEEIVAEFLEQYYDIDSLREVIDRDEWIMYVADAGEEVVGFVSGGPDSDEPELLHLNRVYVAPEHWGNSIGGRLLDAFEEDATRQEFDRVKLRVMVDNDQAVGFYESAGYDRRDEIYDESVETNSYVYVKAL